MERRRQPPGRAGIETRGVDGHLSYRRGSGVRRNGRVVRSPLTHSSATFFVGNNVSLRLLVSNTAFPILCKPSRSVSPISIPARHPLPLRGYSHVPSCTCRGRTTPRDSRRG